MRRLIISLGVPTALLGISVLLGPRDMAAQPQSVFQRQPVLRNTPCPPTLNPGLPAALYTCTATGAVYTWLGSNWASISSLETVYVRKTANESVTSSTALQDDDHLFFTIAANTTWVVEWVLAYDAATAGDLVIAMNVPAGAAGRLNVTVLSTAATSSAGESAYGSTTTLTDAGIANLGGAGAGVTISAGTIRTLVRNAGTAGTVRLRWAQRVSSATATILLTDSFVSARRVE